MISKEKRWKTLLFFGLGLALAAGFCMKWLESDFYSGNQLFTIMGLELFYPQNQVASLLQSMEAKPATILRYHLVFDFAFMTGIFPAIASFCMVARAMFINASWRKWLLVFASAQLLAWGLDITENLILLDWLGSRYITTSFQLFHVIVSVKWIIAIMGVIAAIAGMIVGRKKMRGD